MNNMMLKGNTIKHEEDLLGVMSRKGFGKPTLQKFVELGGITLSRWQP